MQMRSLGYITHPLPVPRAKEVPVIPVHRTSRFLPYLFWFVCIPIRFAVSTSIILIGQYADRWLYVAGIYMSITGVGFLYNIIQTCRGKKEYGGFGGKVWWVRMRHVHVLLWFTSAIFALLQKPWAGYILVVDPIVGAIAGLIHYSMGNQL